MNKKIPLANKGYSTEAGRFWKAAGKADSMEAYVKEHVEDLDLEALKAEAEAGDASLSRQFQAVALLCAAEYQNYLNTREGSVWEEFWTSMEEAFYPYDCLMPIFGAADNLEGQTLVNLIQGAPDDSLCGAALPLLIRVWMGIPSCLWFIISGRTPLYR